MACDRGTGRTDLWEHEFWAAGERMRAMQDAQISVASDITAQDGETEGQRRCCDPSLVVVEQDAKSKERREETSHHASRVDY